MKAPIRKSSRIKWEEMRQARLIHGGWARMLGVAAAIRASRVTIPIPSLRLSLYRTIYGKKYAELNEQELEKPLADYASLNELFARGVPASQRPISSLEPCCVSPCDGTVQDVGTINVASEIIAKQVHYTLSQLAPRTDTRPFQGGPFAVIFLSPQDCHRVFAPDQCRLKAITHVPGYRFLVHPPFQRPEYPVFSLNERLVFELDTDWGSMLLVMVAGWGVGCMTHPFPLAYKRQSTRINSEVFQNPRPLHRGEWLATFELGSTVILISTPRRDVQPLIQPHQPLRYGEILFGQSPFLGAPHA